MLTLNQLLQVGGLDPASVRLVRHAPAHQIHRAVFDCAMNGDQRFREYQDSQVTESVIRQFRATKYLAAFVVDPTTKQTVFMGMWELLGERVPTQDPFSPNPPGPRTVTFATRLCEPFDAYRGRLVIDWGNSERAWVQRADRRDKPIIELRQRREDPAFPGFMTLKIPLHEVETIPIGWSEVLRNARGVYLLVHRESGHQYVGSAFGEGGFLWRWRCYADGHGGNVAMKKLASPSDAYDATILEVVGSEATAQDVFDRETLWKTKLGTRVTGLNRN